MSSYYLFIPGCLLVSLSQYYEQFSGLLLILGIIFMVYGIIWDKV